jgi:hypothetical protein
MSNPTTPFSWQMPTSTDLVTDLPADFEVFGQAVATSMADLLGGTTGQILSKTSNTDMDFTWIANDQGDITAVNVTSPITGGGSAGAVTVGIQDALTTQKGAVQLSDSTSTTSSILAATPTAVKSAYDLANTANTTATAAVPKSTVTAAGDVIYATGSGAVTRLGIGTAGQVLTVNAGATAPSWATASGGFGTLTAYTPTWTGITLGNGTFSQVGYSTSGDLVWYFGQCLFGSTTTYTGVFKLSLPVNAVGQGSGIWSRNPTMWATFTDTSTGYSYPSFTAMESANPATKLVFGSTLTNGAYLQNQAQEIQQTVPITFDTGDGVFWSVIYRKA